MANKKKTTFFLAIVLTILVVRVTMKFLPLTSLLYTDWLHHIYIGIFLVAVSLLFFSGLRRSLISGIGLALVIDELWLIPYLTGLLQEQNVGDAYWGTTSWFTIVISTTLVLLFRKKIDFFWK